MDYYRVLGVRRDATADEIKKAFRQLALQFHPDRHSQSSKLQKEVAGRRFREVSAAYEVLSDSKKRAIYNREGRAGLQYERQQQSSGRRYGGGPRQSYGANYGGDRYGFHRSSRGWGSAGGNHWNWSFRVRPFSPVDIVFNVLLAGIVLYGYTFGDKIGRFIWEGQNTGKSFKDVMEAKERAKEEKRLAAEKESSWIEKTNLDAMDSESQRKQK